MRKKPLTAAELGLGDVKWVLSDIYHLDIGRVDGDEAYFLCVAHNDTNPSASVNLKTGWWHCWACGSGGDLVNLGTYIFKASRIRMELILSPTEPTAKRAAIMRSCEALRRRQEIVTAKEGEGFVGRVHDPDEFDDEPLDYLRNRGFSDEILKMFGVRYGKRIEVHTKTGRKMDLKQTVAIPLYDDKAELLAWCFRATNRSPEYQPRYFYTTGISLKPWLFAEHRVSENAPVVVTEGPLDAMWCWQAGFQSVAIFGTGNASSVEKIEKLSNFRRVILFGDRDQAGAQFVLSLGSLISPLTAVSIVRYRKAWAGTDPNTLTLDQVRWAIEHSIAFHDWRMRYEKRG